MNQLPNYGFLLFVIGLLGIIELYNFKENFKPYRYDGLYDRYHENHDLLHIPESSSDRDGLKCQIEKNIKIKGIQDEKFDTYKEMKNTMNNVLYGDKQFDEIKFPENYGDITQEMEQINQVNQTVCPPVCHLLNNEEECNNAIDIRTRLNNIDELNTTKPVFNNTYMMNEAYKCLNIENPSASNCGDNCRVNSDLNKCVYDIKKCTWDSDKEKCNKKCSFYDRKGNCPKDYCDWNESKLICEDKTN